MNRLKKLVTKTLGYITAEVAYTTDDKYSFNIVKSKKQWWVSGKSQKKLEQVFKLAHDWADKEIEIIQNGECDEYVEDIK